MHPVKENVEGESLACMLSHVMSRHVNVTAIMTLSVTSQLERADFEAAID